MNMVSVPACVNYLAFCFLFFDKNIELAYRNGR